MPWRTLTGVGGFAIVQSYLTTATKWGMDYYDVLYQLFITEGWLPPAAEPLRNNYGISIMHALYSLE